MTTKSLLCLNFPLIGLLLISSFLVACSAPTPKTIVRRLVTERLFCEHRDIAAGICSSELYPALDLWRTICGPLML